MSQNWSEKERVIWETVQSFNGAFAANDVERYFSYLAEDVVVITPHSPYRIEGIAHDREGFEYALQTGTGQVNYFQALQPHIRVNGDTAIVTYYSRGNYGLGAQAKTAYYKETDILIRRDEEWKITHIHVSSGG